MSLDQAVRVLDLCRDYCGRELETMDILGGEPLLWPYLKEYVEVLLKRGIKPWIFSNMLGITDETAKWLFERQVHVTGKLNINPEDESQFALQAQMIGCNVQLAKEMIKAIDVFLDAGYRAPQFRLQNLVRRLNIDFVPEYYRWCLRRNIETDLELMGSGEPIGSEYWLVAPRPQQIAEMIERIQEVRQEFGLEPAEVLMPHVFGSCPFYDRGLYFAADGKIRACSNSTVNLASMSDDQPIARAYESELICHRLNLAQAKVGEPCRSCDKWEKCRGGCRATAEGFGGPYAGYPLCPMPFLTGSKAR
jgi:radical SAM protein with 4Fe4S-binding SPASM domain